MGSIIEIGTIKDVEPWAQLRIALWPHHSLEDHCAELARSLSFVKWKSSRVHRSK